MYEIVSGSMVWISLGLFLFGFGFQSYRFFNMTKKKQRLEMKITKPAPKKKKKKGEKKPKKKSDKTGLDIIPPLFDPLVALVSKPWNRIVRWVRASMYGAHPALTIMTLTFHVLLLLTPIFLLAHNEMIGWAFPSLPEYLSDFFTVVVILCCTVFLIRRIFVRRVRSITGPYDYFVLLITAVPFVTGFMAYHQFFDYRTVLLIHMISGEAALILIPFTRLGHALFFFFYRFLIGSEYSFGQGRRAW